MKTALLTILTLTSFSGMAMAADKSTDVNSGTYAVERMICSKMYVSATGAQSPTYRAGMDAQGRPVAPADINPVVDNAPDYVEVPMTIDLAQRMGLTQPGAQMLMPVANLKLYKDGRVEYNGQDISSNAGTLCTTGKKSDARFAPVAPTAQVAPSPQSMAGQYAPHPSSNPSYVSSSVAPSHTMVAPAMTAPTMTAPAMVEPAAGQDQMLSARSSTVTPQQRNVYQSDSVAPDQVAPQSANVAASATNVPPPRMPVQLQRSTVNMAPRTAQ